MDLTFLKVRVFRKNFIIYTVVLAIVCLTLYFAIISSVYLNTVSNHEKQSDLYFYEVESQIQEYEKLLENYVQSVYANKLILNDFLYYFGHTAEQYYTQKLMGLDDSVDISFINDLKKFILQQDGIVRQVNFIADRDVNSVCFRSTGHLSYIFNTSLKNFESESSLPQYYHVYERDLPLPSNYARKMGTIQFILDVEPIIKNAEILKADNNIIQFAYAATDNMMIDVLNNGEKLTQQFQQIQNMHAGARGHIRAGGLNYLHYNFSISTTSNFQLITGIDTFNIIKHNGLNYLLLFVVFIILFLLMFVLIASRMNIDAKYINSIIDYINNFKKGDFDQEKIIQRDDEYSMIATALNEMADEINRYIEQQYLFQLKQQKAEMAALENQINPHFLYNTLEIIRSKAYINGDDVVANAIYSLGSMYRNMVKGNSVITIEEELAMLEKYLNLMEFKYTNNFYYQIDMPQEMLELKTVKFWMQPIVENFFEHGFNKDSEYNVLLILGEKKGNQYYIRFVDNGTQVETEKLKEINSRLHTEGVEITGEHVGLKNVYSRLRYFYGAKFEMEIENNENGGITIVVGFDREEGEENHV